MSDGYPATGSGEGPAVTPLRVLLAEDDEASQELALFLLRSRGHQVTTVANGREALEAVDGCAYDVVLLDVHMPVMDGIEAALELQRRDCGGRRPRLVALTAQVIPEEQEKLRKAGFDQVITKPLRFDELFREIERRSGAS